MSKTNEHVFEPDYQENMTVKKMRFESSNDTINNTIDVGQMKSITGGDKIPCRELYDTNNSFKPMFKLQKPYEMLLSEYGLDTTTFFMNQIKYSIIKKLIFDEICYDEFITIKPYLIQIINEIIEHQKSIKHKININK